MNKFKERFNRLATLENLGYGIIFFLPCYLIRFTFLGIPTNLLELLMGIFLILFLAEKNNRQKVSLFCKENKKYLIGFGVLIFGLWLSTSLNENSIKGLGIIKSWFLFPAAFSLALVLLVEKEKKTNLFRAYYYSTLGVAFWGIILVILGKTTYDGRLEIFFNSPNYLAMYLAPGILWGALESSKKSWKKYFFLLILLLALFFTFSYLAWFAISGTLAGMALGASKKAFKKVFWGSIIMVAIFLIFALRTEKMKDLVNLNTRSSIVSRAIIWRSAGQILKDNWIIGIGLSNFQAQYLARQKDYPPYLEWAVPHPHSLYLAFWLSAGFFGFLAFLTMLFWWFKDLINHKKRETLLGLISLSIILYFLLHGLADTTYFKNDLAVIFWLAFLASL